MTPDRADDPNRMRWARDAIAAVGKSQRDIARAWQTSESTVSRWLDGVQAADLSLARAVIFANLTKLSISEIATHLGHPPDKIEEGERTLSPQNTPPIPTIKMDPVKGSTLFRLLLHLELSPTMIAKIVSSLEQRALDQVLGEK